MKAVQDTNIPIPEFSGAYNRAHRQYVFISAILVAWELIGLDVKESPIQNINVALKTPQAIPYVLIALVFYSAYRITVEWYQSDSRRRSTRVSRIDFAITHGLGLTSLLIFLIQVIIRIQVFSLIHDPKIFIFWFLLISAFVYLIVLALKYTWHFPFMFATAFGYLVGFAMIPRHTIWDIAVFFSMFLITHYFIIKAIKIFERKGILKKAINQARTPGGGSGR